MRTALPASDTARALLRRRARLGQGGGEVLGGGRTGRSGTQRSAAVGGGVLHVGHGDHAAGARGLHAGEIDLQLLRGGAHGRDGLHATGAAHLLGVHGVAADHGADDGAFVFAVGLCGSAGVDLAAVIGGDDLGGIVRRRAADALLRAMVMAGGLGLGALARVRVDLEVGQGRRRSR